MNEEDDSEFARLMPGVKRLRSDRVNVYQQREQKKRSSRMTGSTPSTSASLPSQGGTAAESHFNTGLQTKIQRKIRQGGIRPESSIDLHGFRQQEAIDVLSEFLEDALQQRMRMILIIHGQGFRSQSDAVLKPLVQRWLATHPQVLAWCPASPRDGAAGASYVYLRGN